ncbi:MAG TPA: dihydroorotate dehydrogenase electron transfer subunit [Thermoplasmata archaeon]|nr:dihydroorotate dehydrogenase electron transfer subunit [Thermoplasmata archaeon]
MAAHKIFTITEQKDEATDCKTVRFDGDMDAQPGQFVMVWVPGVDEFPMSVSYVGDNFGVTYRVIGDGTRSLSAMNPGAKIGIRGPYGRGFEITGKRMLAVAGGTGMASIAPLVEKAVNSGVEVDLVIGAKTASELMMRGRCEEAGAKVHISTDDGSEGAKGLATDIAADIIQGGAFDSVCACGPERMAVGILHLTKKHGLPLQASLERHMKCGIGICDSCAIDGRHVCVDGPVFSGEILASLTDLGRTRLNPSGRRVPLD